MKSFWLISTMLLWFPMLYAKGDDTTVWHQFELIGRNSEITTGAIRINLDVKQGSSLADVLNTNSALFVKYYSPGGLASTSLRGMGAQHTAVMWNGINLQSNMNSNMDLNLLPAFFIDKAAIETGANASTCGSGAIAGAIVLNNEVHSERKIYGESIYGSFGQKTLAFGVNYRFKKWSSNTRLIHKYAKNDFSFQNIFIAQKPFETMQNNSFLQQGITQSFGLKLHKHHTLESNIWHLNTRRQLPAAMGAANTSNEKQDDDNTMAFLEHQWQINKAIRLKSKLAYLNEKIVYFNAYYPTAHNSSQSVIVESTLTWMLNSYFEFESSINSSTQTAQTDDGYPMGVKRQLYSLFTRLNYQNKMKVLKFSLGNRLLKADTEFAPATPDLGIEIQLFKELKLKSNASYSFRLPSFNDLYWRPGGNIDLRAEKGKKIDISLEFKINRLKLAATTFINHVDDWIMWQPIAGSVNWKAFNVLEVESRGVELTFESKWSFKSSQYLCFNGRIQYVESVYANTSGYNKSIIGNQLFYTPKHTGFLNGFYQKGKYAINLSSTYTGSRFTSSENKPESILEAYTLFNVSLSRELKFKKYNSTIEFSVFNMGNANYQAIENRPMPLRNYQIKYKFNIHYE